MSPNSFDQNRFTNIISKLTVEKNSVNQKLSFKFWNTMYNDGARNLF